VDRSASWRAGEALRQLRVAADYHGVPTVIRSTAMQALAYSSEVIRKIRGLP
jgi:hypothetical protein